MDSADRPQETDYSDSPPPLPYRPPYVNLHILQEDRASGSLQRGRDQQSNPSAQPSARPTTEKQRRL